ncbi:MAG: hypothetical protein IPK70_07460 [Flavobacteriales bacterium]|nr:hypothetical protein [Flavobacteriales bacterium]
MFRPCAFLLAAAPLLASAQPIDTVLLAESGRFQFPYWAAPPNASYYSLHSRFDRLERPYLYMACAEQGLVTLDISDLTAPVPVDTIWPADLSGLKVMNVEQVDELLYVCIGAFEGTAQMAGLAIVEVSDPVQPVLLDLWTDPAFANGASSVRVQEGVAYVGVMEDGVVALDVSDPASITFISSFQPDPSWPGIAGYPPATRGMDIVDSLLFLAYDAGGLRILSVNDPAAMVELGRYVNPQQPALTPPAYNHVAVVGDKAYVTVDFCGLEVVDVSEPAAMAQLHWLNPWNCIGFSWFGSDGHANETATSMGDSLLFVSGGDSELLVYDISGPVPALRGGHILPNDTAAAWGVDVFGDRAVSSFVNNANLPFQPYYSSFGGVVIHDWTVDFGTGLSYPWDVPLVVSPNPAMGLVGIDSPFDGPVHVAVTNALGCVLRSDLHAASSGHRLHLDLAGLPPGLYQISMRSGQQERHARIVLQSP